MAERRSRCTDGIYSVAATGFKYADTRQNSEPTVGVGRKGLKLSREVGEKQRREKAYGISEAPVPQTDTGR